MLEELGTIGETLKESWKRDVLPMRVWRDLWRDIAPALRKFPTQSVYIRDWYESATLAGIRRVTEFSADDVISVRRALMALRRLCVGEELSIDTLVALSERLGRNHEDPRINRSLIERNLRFVRDHAGEEVAPTEDIDHTPVDPEEIDHHIRDAIEAVLAERMGRDRSDDSDDEDVATPVIDVRVVQSELDMIQTVADKAHQIATSSVAHRLHEAEDFETEPLTHDEVSELLEQLAGIYRRWSLLLRFVDVDTDIDHFARGGQLLTALNLHDDEKLRAAISEALHSRFESGQTPISRRAMEKLAKVSYHIPEH